MFPQAVQEWPGESLFPMLGVTRLQAARDEMRRESRFLASLGNPRSNGFAAGNNRLPNDLIPPVALECQTRRTPLEECPPPLIERSPHAFRFSSIKKRVEPLRRKRRQRPPQKGISLPSSFCGSPNDSRSDVELVGLGLRPSSRDVFRSRKVFDIVKYKAGNPQ